MGNKVYAGVDNGISGSVGIVGDNIESKFHSTPIKKEQDYTKKKKNISRLDCLAFMALFSEYNKNDLVFIIERPLVNSKMFNATASALRCHEAELIMIEMMGCRVMFIDSKEWQKALLPSGCKGDELKIASKNIGDRLFPALSECKHKDRDGLLIAEYARRQNL